MHHFSVQDVLERAGLLVYQPAEEGKPRQIDWSKTKEVQSLGRNVERLKRMVERPPMC